MMPMTIEKQIEIAAKATTVWRYVGTEEGLRQWWGIDIALEEKLGGRCEERTHWCGRICYLRGKVTSYDPPHQLALLLQNEDEADVWPAWTTISITLTESNGRTQVALVHQAFGQLERESAMGQYATMPPSTVGPHAIWNMRQPQNSIRTGTMVDGQPTLTVHPSSSPVDSAWLAQEELRWRDSLQALANQVMLAQDAHDG